MRVDSTEVRYLSKIILKSQWLIVQSLEAEASSFDKVVSFKKNKKKDKSMIRFFYNVVTTVELFLNTFNALNNKLKIKVRALNLSSVTHVL